MRIFVSSTFEDLAEHRRAAIQALRELGHDVVAMEEFTAASAPPWKTVKERIDRCEAYVGIFAWRYGFLLKADDVDVRPGDDPPVERSFTHAEYLFAHDKGLKTLAFLLGESTPWLPGKIDAFDAVENSSRTSSARGIMELRRELQSSHVVSYFTSPDDLATRVATAVTNLGIGQRLFRNVIPLTTPVPVTDGSSFGGIQNEIKRASVTGRRVSTIDISDPTGGWWSTRLYMLAVLADAFTNVRRIAIVDTATPPRDGDPDGRVSGFVGMLSTSTVARILGRLFPKLTDFESAVRTMATEGLDQERALNEAQALWHPLFSPSNEPTEKRDVTRPNLVSWFGDAMLVGTVDVADVESPTLLDVVRILGYPNEFVPVATRSVDDDSADRRGEAPAGAEQQVDGAAPTGAEPQAGGAPTPGAVRDEEWSAAPVTLIDKQALNQQLAQQYVDDLMERARLR